MHAYICYSSETIILCLCLNNPQVDILFLILYLITLYCCSSVASSTASLRFHCVFVDGARLPCIPIGFYQCVYVSKEPVVSSARHQLYNTETLWRQEHLAGRKSSATLFC